MIDLEEIRDIVSRSPNIRGKTILHLLEKRKKVEELREQRKGRDAMVKEMNAMEPPTSFFQWLLNGGK